MSLDHWITGIFFFFLIWKRVGLEKTISNLEKLGSDILRKYFQILAGGTW